MAMVLEEVCDPGDLERCSRQFHLALTQHRMNSSIQFQYAWCLVRSNNKNQLQEGANLLQDLFRKARNDQEKRDYLYYMAVACARLKDYDKALRYVDGILKVQPTNHQVVELKEEINKRMKKDGLVGMAVAGGAVAVMGAGIAALIGVALSRR